MKTIKLKELEKYQVIGDVEEVKVLVSGKEDKRARKAKYNAVVNPKGTEVEKLTSERGTIIFDVENGVFVSRHYSVKEYSEAKTEARRLAGENKRPYTLLQVYLVCEARRTKGTAEYIPQTEEAVYENYFVSTIPVSTEPENDVVID